MTRILKNIWLIINILSSAALLVSGYGGHINPDIWPLGGIALMIFPAVLAGIILVIAIDLIAWRRLTFVPTFALLACAPAIWNLCPLNIGHHKASPSERELSVMTYNVFNYYDVRKPDSCQNSINTYSIIIAADADIVCMQEAPPVLTSSNWGTPELRDTLMARYPYRTTTETQNIWSKYPFEIIDMPGTGEPTAIFQCVRVQVDGSEVIVYNIHLQSIELSQEDKELYGDLTTKPTTHRIENSVNLIEKLSFAMKKRAIQARNLHQVIDSIGGDRVIVCGDFNDIEGCYAQRCLSGHQLRSLYTSVGFGPVITYNANRFYFNIDHILYGGLRPLEYKCIDVKASDHYPVWGLFALPAADAQPKTAKP